ncbi:MAG: hypothetical protein WB710_12850, partial [Stellaceae bacterium]
GYTIRGVQKLLRDGALRADQPPPADGAGEATEATEATEAIPFAHDPVAVPAEAADGPAPSGRTLRAALEAVQRDLKEIRALLDKLVLP